MGINEQSMLIDALVYAPTRGRAAAGASRSVPENSSGRRSC